MALGPSDPVWQKLYDQLALLAADCNGSCAFVVDKGNRLWCVGVAGESSTFNTRIRCE